MPAQDTSVFGPALNTRGPSYAHYGLYQPGLGALSDLPGWAVAGGIVGAAWFARKQRMLGTLGATALAVGGLWWYFRNRAVSVVGYVITPDGSQTAVGQAPDANGNIRIGTDLFSVINTGKDSQSGLPLWYVDATT